MTTFGCLRSLDPLLSQSYPTLLTFTTTVPRTDGFLLSLGLQHYTRTHTYTRTEACFCFQASRPLKSLQAPRSHVLRYGVLHPSLFGHWPNFLTIPQVSPRSHHVEAMRDPGQVSVGSSGGSALGPLALGGLLIQECLFGQKLSCSLHRGLPARLALDWHLETWPLKLSWREEVVLVVWPRLFVQMM